MSTSYSLLLLVTVLLIMISSANSTTNSITSSSAAGNDDDQLDNDMSVAIEEMQKANYFTFVMLINMALPPPQSNNNITFLMPNDRTLSKADIVLPNSTSVVDFLLQHSIPSPLLIDHLEHFPTGSIIPTSSPGFVLKVKNEGRRRFFLNNIRIVSPNICTKGSSIRCHGIDGVLHPAALITNQPPPLTPPPPTSSCPNNYSTTLPMPPAPLPAPSPMAGGFTPVAPVTAPPPFISPPRKSSSSTSITTSPAARKLGLFLQFLVIMKFLSSYIMLLLFI